MHVHRKFPTLQKLFTMQVRRSSLHYRSLVPYITEAVYHAGAPEFPTLQNPLTMQVRRSSLHYRNRLPCRCAGGSIHYKWRLPCRCARESAGGGGGWWRGGGARGCQCGSGGGGTGHIRVQSNCQAPTLQHHLHAQREYLISLYRWFTTVIYWIIIVEMQLIHCEWCRKFTGQSKYIKIPLFSEWNCYNKCFQLLC